MQYTALLRVMNIYGSSVIYVADLAIPCHELSYEHIWKFCNLRRRLIPCHELSYEHIWKFCNLVRKLMPCHELSYEHIWNFRLFIVHSSWHELSYDHKRISLVRYSFFIAFVRPAWSITRSIASVGLAQARPNYNFIYKLQYN